MVQAIRFGSDGSACDQACARLRGQIMGCSRPHTRPVEYRSAHRCSVGMPRSARDLSSGRRKRNVHDASSVDPGAGGPQCHVGYSLEPRLRDPLSGVCECKRSSANQKCTRSDGTSSSRNRLGELGESAWSAGREGNRSLQSLLELPNSLQSRRWHRQSGWS